MKDVLMVSLLGFGIAMMLASIVMHVEHIIECERVGGTLVRPAWGGYACVKLQRLQ